MTMRVLVRTVAAAVVAFSLLAVAGGPAGASAPILGGGSGFAALLLDQWRADTARSPYNLSINYVAQGSSFGRNQFTGGQFDYGASDIQYMQLEIPDLQSHRCAGKTLAQCFVYVPVTAGGLAFMYNLTDNSGNRVTNLRLTRKAACEIFTGAITKWNAPDIVATNPRLASVSRDIKPVIRSDGAGESFVLSQYCIAIEPGIWNAFVAQQRASGNAPNLTPEFSSGQPTSIWPQEAWGARPNPVATADGTASFVADPVSGANSITYVAAGYAKVRNFPTASVENAAGVFTQPDETNVTVALGYATPLGNGTFKLAFSGPDPRAYFPSTYSYILAQTAGFNPSKGATLGTFLCYAISAGQPEAPSLRYARLSSALVNIAENAIVQIPGAPSRSNCFVAGAPAPPPPPSVLGLTPGLTTPGSTLPAGLQSANTIAQNAAALRSLAAHNPSARAAAAALAAQAKKAAAARAAIQRAANAAAAAQQQGENLDAKLAKDAAGHHPSHSSHTPVIYLLLAGAVLAWGATLFMSRRRSVP